MLTQSLPIIRSTSRAARHSYVELYKFFSSKGIYQTLHERCYTNERLSIFDRYKESTHFPEATHEINEEISRIYETKKFSSSNTEEIVLHGYLGGKSVLSGKLCFFWLYSKHLSCKIQVVSSNESLNKKLKSLRTNSPIIVTGRFKDKRPSKSDGYDRVRKIDDVEVNLIEVQVLNDFPSDIIAPADGVFAPDRRHLQLRFNKDLRDALEFRAKAASICRHVLDGLGFIEVETPLLFKSTPEGAREFIVPTRRKGLAYALPQSPQQFKQTIMASGIPKYYQIAKCFRDEDQRADRQPEFTQLDLEMSFATGSDVIDCIEVIMRNLWKQTLVSELPPSFPQMTYEEAMSDFGSDKPDLRIRMKPLLRIEHLLPADLISKISPLKDPIVEAMLLPLSNHCSPKDTHKFISNFLDSTTATPFHENLEGGPGVFIYDSSKPLSGLQAFGFEGAERVEDLLNAKDGDLIILQARRKEPFSGSSTSLGNMRLALVKTAIVEKLMDALRGFEPLWITDFPLFSPSNISGPGQGGSAGLASTHHPFTSPKSPEDIDLLRTNPSQVIGDHYDLVMNGVELGGGSRRIHNADMQELVMREVLQMPPERIAEFSHLLEVLQSGCPPHAGIALGFDRLIAVMLGKESVRDVIAFPKSGKGEDLLVKSPSKISEEVLRTYHLQIRN